MASGVISQTPYWPSEHHSVHVPVANNANSIQHYDLNNQTTLRNLLFNKLGGISFSNDHQRQQQPYNTATFNSQDAFDVSFPQDQVYPITMNTINPVTVVGSANNSGIGTGTCDLPLNILQGFGNFQNDLTEMVCVNPQQIDGQMQGFYGMESIDMTNNNGSSNTTSTESTSWGDMSSLVYSPLVSDYEGCPQGIPQDVTFEESRYFGIQLQ